MISLNSRLGKSQPNKKTYSNLEATRIQLKTLSNTKLLQDLEKLNKKEQKLKVLVLLYLSEIDKRELYLPLGYSSLFDFCTLRLKYTRATAARRIRATRTAVRYPMALDLLRSGEIHITTLSMISDILNRDNHAELLDSIKHKSTREVEMLVSRHRPVPVIRDTVRPVCVRRRVENTPEVSGGGSNGAAGSPRAGVCGQDLSPTEDTRSRKCNKLSSSAGTKPGDSDAWRGGAGSRAETTLGKSDAPTDGDGSRVETNPAGQGPVSRVILEQRLKLGFSVSPEFMAKYNKIKALLSSTYPEGIDFETLFEHLMNEYLEKHDPERKRERRAGRRTQRDSDRRGNGTGASQRNSRHIPTAVRDQVYARDRGRCSFKSANGRRCNSTWDLEMDHIVPYARGGDNSPDNLRLLCRKHNMHQAERVYGGEFMKDRIKRE